MRINILKLANGVNTAITVAGFAVTAYQTMLKTAKWFEEKKTGKKKEPIVRPVIKG